MKRKPWNDYFLDIAKAVSQRSTCLRRQYGAVIVKNNTIVSTGYNGSPPGDINCIDVDVCERERLNVPKGERYELCKAIHAEQNAIISGDPLKMEGATIYIYGTNTDGSLASGEPCLICSPMIKRAKISKVVYLDKDSNLQIYIGGCFNGNL